MDLYLLDDHQIDSDLPIAWLIKQQPYSETLADWTTGIPGSFPVGRSSYKMYIYYYCEIIN